MTDENGDTVCLEIGDDKERARKVEESTIEDGSSSASECVEDRGTREMSIRDLAGLALLATWVAMLTAVVAWCEPVVQRWIDKYLRR